MGECFNCSGPAATTATLVFETGLRLEDQAICAGCLDFFGSSDRFLVHEGRAVVRGGGHPP